MQDKLLSYFIPPMTEVGIPHAGRKVILSSLNPEKKIIWISNSKSNTTFFPSGWTDLSLDKIFFLKIENVIKDAKPVFLQPCFDTIVIDGFRNLRDDDLAFMAIQARAHKIQIILVRDFFLTPNIGNIWARSRFNIFYNPKLNTFKIQTVRGIFSKKYEVRAFQ